MAMSAASGGGMLPTSRRKPLFRTFVSLYRSEFAFQGMVDFAAIGLVVLLFLHPPSKDQMRSWLSRVGIGSSETRPEAAATAPPQTGPSQMTKPGPGQASVPPAGSQPPQGPQAGLTPQSKPIIFPAEIAKPALANVMLVEIGETAFRNSRAADQQRLLAARSAYRSGRGAEIVDILKDADGRDPNVAFMRGLGLLFRGDEASVKAAEEALRTATAANHTLAEALLGRLLVTAPKGVTKNVAEGQRLIEAAATGGDPQGQRVAAIAYIGADFGSFQPDRAAALFKRAAEAGDPQAMFHYARVLSEGIGVPPDRAGAIDYLGRAAAAGLTSAQLTLGDILLEQYEAKTLNDPADAVAWYERAAQKGFSWYALNKLQRLYGWAGRDTPWNDKKRYYELTKQCSGLADMYCQYSFSVVFQEGWGTAKDPFRAYVHALIARDLGQPNIKTDLIDKLGNLLTAKERADAMERARTLRPKLKPVPNLVVFQYPDAVRPSPWASIEDIEKGTPSQQAQPGQPGGQQAAVPIGFPDWSVKPSGFYYWRIAFDPQAFNNEPPQLRSALLAARAAYVEQNPQAIVDALRGADASNPSVNLFKGIATLRLSDDPPDAETRGLLMAESFRHLNAAAGAGDVKAAAILGVLQTLNLQGIPRDVSRAQELAERAARSNDAFAVRQLGINMLTGAFGSADPARAADLMWTAAELGDPVANIIISAFFQNGTGVPVDMEKAEKYLRRAADLGLTNAQAALGDWILNRYAKKLIPSPEEGVRYLERAYNGGRYLYGVWRLAVLYDYEGRDPPWRDRNKALDYARKCAPYSYEYCHFSLGVIYANLNDSIRSWASYTIARGLGSSEAVGRLDTLEKSMTQSELDRARKLADQIKRELRPIPTGIVVQDVAAAAPIGALTPVAAVNYADELTDWGIRAQTNLKYDVGSKTPITIPGGRRITTQELKDLGSRALVLDVLDERTGHYTIPGAIHLPGAGNYGSGHFDDRLQDNFYAALSGLARRYPDRPLVFFCASAQCWESYNAALRAMKMGFQNVLWYRGGLLSWKAANLPVTAPTETQPIR